GVLGRGVKHMPLRDIPAVKRSPVGFVGTYHHAERRLTDVARSGNRCERALWQDAVDYILKRPVLFGELIASANKDRPILVVLPSRLGVPGRLVNVLGVRRFVGAPVGHDAAARFQSSSGAVATSTSRPAQSQGWASLPAARWPASPLSA